MLFQRGIYMSLLFIERRYNKLLARASALKYEFNANPEHETPLRETVELFINDYAKKPWSRFLSFIPFTPERAARKLASKYLDQLAFYVTCAPITVKLLQENNESKTFKRQAESLAKTVKARNEEVRELKLEVKGLQSLLKNSERQIQVLEDNAGNVKRSQASNAPFFKAKTLTIDDMIEQHKKMCEQSDKRADELIKFANSITLRV
jgi:hypothetical protein